MNFFYNTDISYTTLILELDIIKRFYKYQFREPEQLRCRSLTHHNALYKQAATENSDFGGLHCLSSLSKVFGNLLSFDISLRLRKEADLSPFGIDQGGK